MSKFTVIFQLSGETLQRAFNDITEKIAGVSAQNSRDSSVQVRLTHKAPDPSLSVRLVHDEGEVS